MRECFHFVISLIYLLSLPNVEKFQMCCCSLALLKGCLDWGYYVTDGYCTNFPWQ